MLPLAVTLGPLFTLCSPTVVCVASGCDVGAFVHSVFSDCCMCCLWLWCWGLCSLCVLRLLYVLPLAVVLGPLFTLCSPTVVCVASGCDIATFVHSVFSDCCKCCLLAVTLGPLFTLCSPTVVCVASGCDVGAFVHSVFSDCCMCCLWLWCWGLCSLCVLRLL